MTRVTLPLPDALDRALKEAEAVLRHAGARGRTPGALVESAPRSSGKRRLEP